jgi:hypothetical protein
VGVELLSSDGGLPDYPPYPNSEYHGDYLGSQSAREKLRGREGNNPDRLLRSQSSTQSLRMLEYNDSRDVGLEAAII